MNQKISAIFLVAILVMVTFPPIEVEGASYNLIESEKILDIAQDENASYNVTQNLYNETIIVNNMTFSPFLDNITEKGRLIYGPKCPSILTTKNYTGWVSFAQLITIQESYIMGGTSVSWIRLPIYSGTYDFRLEVYHVYGGKIANITSFSDNQYYGINNACENSIIYNKTFEGNKSLYNDLMMTSENIQFANQSRYYNFTYVNMVAPLYSGHEYYFVISVDLTSEPVSIYATSSDIGEDNRYEFVFANNESGLNVTAYPIDLDIVMYFTYGLGGNVAGWEMEKDDVMYWEWKTESIPNTGYQSLMWMAENVTDSLVDLYCMDALQAKAEPIFSYNINNRNWTEGAKLTSMGSGIGAAPDYFYPVVGGSSYRQRIRINYSDLLMCGGVLRLNVKSSFAGKYLVDIWGFDSEHLIRYGVLGSNGRNRPAGTYNISMPTTILFDRLTDHPQIKYGGDYSFDIQVKRDDNNPFSVGLMNLSGNASTSIYSETWYDQTNCYAASRTFFGNPYGLKFELDLNEVSNLRYDNFNRFVLLSEEIGHAYVDGEDRYNHSIELPATVSNWVIRVIAGNYTSFYMVDENHNFDKPKVDAQLEWPPGDIERIQNRFVILRNNTEHENIYFMPYFTLHKTFGKWINIEQIIPPRGIRRVNIPDWSYYRELTPYKMLVRIATSFIRNEFTQAVLHSAVVSLSMTLLGPTVGQVVGEYLWDHWVQPITNGQPPDGPLVTIAAEFVDWVYHGLVDLGQWLWSVGEWLYGKFLLVIDWLQEQGYDLLVLFSFIITMVTYGLWLWAWMNFTNYWVKMGLHGSEAAGLYAINWFNETKASMINIRNIPRQITKLRLQRLKRITKKAETKKEKFETKGGAV